MLCVLVLKQHLKISVRKLKLGSKWAFHMDNDPSIPPNSLQRGLKTTKERYLPENLMTTPKRCAYTRRPTNLTR